MENEEFYCHHLEQQSLLEGYIGVGSIICCGLTHMACLSKPSECLYYKIYEEAYDRGYSEGKLGEDL